MNLTRLPTKIPDLVLLAPKVFGDDRGFFLESYHRNKYREHQIEADFVQDNLSRSQKGVLRGLHFQNPHAQGKLIMVLEGCVYDVAVDARKNSRTFGQWEAFYLKAEDRTQLYVPPGFAHGFCVISESALFSYKCTDFYHPESEQSLLWSDPNLNIPWPIENPLLSDKDKAGKCLKDFNPEQLPDDS